MIKFSKKPSYDDQLKVMKDIEMQVPEVVAEIVMSSSNSSSKQEASSISPAS